MILSPEEQAIHDKVLEDSAKSYLKVTTPQNIKINPGGSKNFDIDGKYPDVIVTLRTGEIIIEQIETESTVNYGSLERWRELSNLGYELRIIVPLNMIDTAKSLAGEITMPVNIQAYEVIGDQVNWLGKNT